MNESRETPRRLARFIGDIFAFMSLLCCISLPLAGALYFFGVHVLAGLTGFQWFKFMGVALAMAIVGTILRSKLWKIALPVSAVIFFFIMYVMGS
jgi:hypothetical protein